MLHFADPWLLLLLLLVPLVMWRWLLRPRPALRFSDTSLLLELPAGRSRWIQRLGTTARALALLLLALAIAGANLPDRSKRIPVKAIAIGMVVDVSGSMAEPDFDWQGESIARLEAVQKAFRLFVAGGEGPDGEKLEGRPGDMICLVAFATRPETVCPLTLTHGVLLRELDKQEPRAVPGESETNIGDALVEGLFRLYSGGPKRKVLVLLSDGEHNVPNPRSGFTPRDAARHSAALGIPIYAIDAGSGLAGMAEAPGAASSTRAAGSRTLHEIAQITGGQCFQAHDAATLLEVCRQIDRLERERVESYHYLDRRELFPWLGLTAFVLLLLVVGLEMTAWQRIP